MEKSKVTMVRLGNPPEGYISCVFSDGLVERTMLVEAGEDWIVKVSIDRSEAVKKTYSLAISPDGSEFSVTKMAPNGPLPVMKKFKSSDFDIEPLSEDQNEVISLVKGNFDE